MNTTFNGVIKHKAHPERVCGFDVSIYLCGIKEDNLGNMYVCSHAGEIIQFKDNGEYQVSSTIKGQPNNVTFDEENNLYFADIANATIFGLNLKASDQGKL
jgi:hypothetical protein